MAESQAKGDIILKVLDQVMIKWGKDGLDTIGTDPKKYNVEQWYSFSELCGLLSKVKSRLGNNNSLAIYQIGFNTIKKDPRWQGIFCNTNPAEVFLTTKRQDDQYTVCTHVATPVGAKHVRIELNNFTGEPVWLEFYRGRLQGVLELTGRTGVVHLLPPGEKADTRIFDIKWG
jgi:hypothetical protein